MRDASRQLRISSPIPLERHTKFEDPSALRLVSVAPQILGVALDAALASQMLHEDAVWKILDSYFSTYGMVRHQIESFNYFWRARPTNRQRDRASHQPDGRLPRDASAIQASAPHKGRERSCKTIPLAVTVPRDGRALGERDMVHDAFNEEEHVSRRVFREVQLVSPMIGSTVCYRTNAIRRTSGG